jgi:hypothetical protein
MPAKRLVFALACGFGVLLMTWLVDAFDFGLTRDFVGSGVCAAFGVGVGFSGIS